MLHMNKDIALCPTTVTKTEEANKMRDGFCGGRKCQFVFVSTKKNTISNANKA